MFESLSDRLRQTVKSLRGQARLTEDNIKDALREVRMALLEADVSLPVIKIFLEQVKERAAGREVMGSLNPGQVLIKVVHEELTNVMGSANEDLNLRQQAPAIILMAGLQGAGKTTTTAKLAQFLKQKHPIQVIEFFLVGCFFFLI
jgi:signal recognition particle subunit SRP54